jgi:predicted N-formylglutamate amidohydrolase
VETISGRLDCGLLILCDHASNALPPAYGSLGLPEGELARHIAWDIGAAQVTRALAALFDAPAVLTRYSRLLIDPNRGADDPTLVMRLSDGAIVPGNRHVDAAEIALRRERYWAPYRARAGEAIDAMSAAGPPPAIVSIHSFTPVWRGRPRPWQIGLLWDRDERLAAALLSGLAREPGIVVGDNEPYDGALMGDTLHELGTQRGLAHVLVELRQELIGSPEGAGAWAGVLARALAPVLGRPDIHMIERHGSRAGSRGSRPTLARP